MQKTSTPVLEKSLTRNLKPLSFPPKYSMRIVLGYAASCRMLKSASIGEMEVVLN